MVTAPVRREVVRARVWLRLRRGATASRAMGSAIAMSAALGVDAGDLVAAAEAARRQVEADPELVPEHWALYHLVPDEVEFWQGDPARRHVRLRYLFAGDAWTRQTLWP